MKNKESASKIILYSIFLWFFIYSLTGLYMAQNGLSALINQSDYGKKASGGIFYSKR